MASQPVRREATVGLTQDTSSNKVAGVYDAADDEGQVAARDLDGERTQNPAI